MNKNRYLEIFKSKFDDLNSFIKENKDMDQDLLSKIISGQIILLQSILELGVGDFYSPEFNKIMNSFYGIRQSFSHYEIFKENENSIEEVNNLHNLLNAVYNDEQDFFIEKTILPSYNVRRSNITIKPTSKEQVIATNNDTYRMYSASLNSYLVVPKEKVFQIIPNNKNDHIEYIIDLNSPYYKSAGNMSELLDTSASEKFFRENYTITNHRSTSHYDMLEKIIKSYTSNPSALHMDKDGNSYKTINVLHSCLINRQINQSLLSRSAFRKKSDALIKSTINFNDVINQAQSVNEPLTTKTAFKIKMLIKYKELLDNEYVQKVRNKSIPKDMEGSYLIGQLSKLYDVSIKKIDSSFIRNQPDLYKLLKKVIKYRNHFSHNIFTKNKENDSYIKDFYNSFSQLHDALKIVLKNNKVIDMKPTKASFCVVDVTKDDIEIVRSSHYVRAKDDLYFANINTKFYYSKDNDNILVSIPLHRVKMYQKDKLGEMKDVSKLTDNSTGKTLYTVENYTDRANDYSLDLNFSAFYNMFWQASDVKKIDNPYIVYNVDGKNIGEPLDMIIHRLENKKYIHPWLLKELNSSKSQMELIDAKTNQTIAIVTSEEQFKKQNIEEIDYNLFRFQDNAKVYRYRSGK